MQLYLVNNDPTSTLLVTGDGIPVFSVETPKLSPTDPGESLATRNGGDSGSEIAQSSNTTTILRLECHYYRCTGKLEVQIGLVVYEGLTVGTRVKISEADVEVNVPPYQMTRAISDSNSLEHEYDYENEGCVSHLQIRYFLKT